MEFFLSLEALIFLSGIALIFLGFFVLLFIVLKSSLLEKSEKEGKSEGGAFLMIGPIPIVITSSKKLGYALLILGLALVIFIFLWLSFLL